MELAIRTAVAAGLAWLLVQPLGSFADKYPYYAPLGAVVAMSTAVIGSVRAGIEAVSAVVVGAVVAVAIRETPLPDIALVPSTVAIGVLLAGFRWFRTMGGWVPIAALFILVIGGSDPWNYVLAYAGLTAFGAAVAIGVNLAIPQFPLTPAVLAQDRLRVELAHQLDELADGLAAEEVLDQEAWTRLCRALDPQARHAQDLVTQAMEARHGNWRAGRWAAAADRRYAEAKALERVTACVDDVVELVTDSSTSVHDATETAAALRAAIADALREVAAMLRTVEFSLDDEDAPEPARDADAAVARLREVLARVAARSPERYLSAAAIAVSLDRAVEAWA